MQASACNFTKSSPPPWMFFTFFKLIKCYQVPQNVTNEKSDERETSWMRGFINLDREANRLSISMWFDNQKNEKLRRYHPGKTLFKGNACASIYLHSQKKEVEASHLRDWQQIVNWSNIFGYLSLKITRMRYFLHDNWD